MDAPVDIPSAHRRHLHQRSSHHSGLHRALARVECEFYFARSWLHSLSCISGSGNTRSALVIELIALFFYVGFISYVVFYLRCSLTVAWCAELFYSLILLLGSFLYMRRGTWLNKKI